MKIPVKTLKNGFAIPVFGLGTWQMGGRETHDPDNDDVRDITAIQRATEAGITHIDTAESYADGYAETLIGTAIAGADRSRLFLVSKIHKAHLRYDDVLRACEASLKRLRTEYLDMYLIHAPNDDIPIADTLRALDTLKEQRLIRAIGVSNFTTKRLRDAQQRTGNPIVVNQVYYNLIMREPEHEGLLAYCQEHDVLLEAYRPLEKGAMLVNPPTVLTDLARTYGKTPAQIALNWLVSQDHVVTISKVSTPEHIEQSLGALGWQMEREDIERLRRDMPGQIKRPDALPLR